MHTPYSGDWPTDPPPAPARRRPGRALLVTVAAASAVAAFGAPLGLLWAFVSPGVPVVKADSGPVLTQSQPEQFIAADGWFAMLGLGFGILAAIAVWWLLRRRRGAVGLVAVTCGAIGAGVLAWWLGRHIGLADYERWRDTAAVGASYLRPADLRAGTARLLWGFLPVVQGNLLVPAFGAAVTYTMLAGWSGDADLDTGRRVHPDEPVNWDSAGRPVPTAVPVPPAPGAAGPPPG